MGRGRFIMFCFPLHSEINICINIKFSVILWMIKTLFHPLHELSEVWLENVSENSDGFLFNSLKLKRGVSTVEFPQTNIKKSYLIQRIYLELLWDCYSGSMCIVDEEENNNGNLMSWIVWKFFHFRIATWHKVWIKWDLKSQCGTKLCFMF